MDSSKNKNDQFLERMSVLNKGFIKFVLKNLEEFPGADLTPTINSYLKHVAELDKKYSEDGNEATKPTQSTLSTTATTTTLSSTSRKRAALPSSDELRSFTGKKAAVEEKSQNGVESIVAVTKPSSYVPEQVENGVDQSKTTEIPSFTKSAGAMSSLFKPADSSSAPSFKSTESSTTFASKPAEKLPSLFKPTDSSATFASKPTEKTQSLFKPAETAPSLFKPADTSFKSADSSFKSSDSSAAPSFFKSTDSSKPAETVKSLFNKPLDSSTTPMFKLPDQSTSLFKSADSSKPAETVTSLFNKPLDSSTTPVFKLPDSSTNLFKSADSSAAPFSFKPTNPSITSSTKPAETVTSLFNKPLDSSTTPVFKLPDSSTNLFKPTESQGTEKPSEPTATEQDENEEPPKTEIVEQKEDDALFSMKTAIYSYKDGKWEKLGVGYVNIKPGEKNNLLLVRAANTLGSIWINTYIAEHFKAFLKGDKAMTVRFPEPGKDDKPQIVQYLLKGGDPEDFKKLADHLKANVVTT